MNEAGEKKRMFITIIALIAAFSAFIALVLRPRLLLIRELNMLIKEQKAVIQYRNDLEAARPDIEGETEETKNRVDKIQRAYYIPVSQEKILMDISRIMSLNGMEIISMSFQDPRKINLGVEELKNGTGVVEDEYLIKARDLLKEALKLKTNIGTGNEWIKDNNLDYIIERVTLSVAFRTGNVNGISEALKNMNTLPAYPVSRLMLSKDQDGWTGNMDIHFYMIPEFVWNDI